MTGYDEERLGQTDSATWEPIDDGFRVSFGERAFAQALRTEGGGISLSWITNMTAADAMGAVIQRRGHEADLEAEVLVCEATQDKYVPVTVTQGITDFMQHQDVYGVTLGNVRGHAAITYRMDAEKGHLLVGAIGPDLDLEADGLPSVRELFEDTATDTLKPHSDDVINGLMARVIFQ